MPEPPQDRNAFYQILTRKIRMLILLVSLIPTVLTLGILLYRFNLAYKEKVNAHLSELVLKHTQSIDAFLLDKLGNIRYLARQFVDASGDAYGQFLANGLKKLRDEYGEAFIDLGLISDQGIQLAYEGPFRLGYADYSNAAWFLNALDRPYYISDVFAGLRGHPHFILAVRVTTRGQTYILRATINFTTFNSMVENVRIGSTGTAFIVNAQGQLQTLARAGVPERMPPDMVGAAVFGNRNTVVVTQKNSHGSTYVYALSRFKNIDWRMVFRQDHKEAFKALRDTEILILVVFVLGCIAILSVSFALPRSIVKLISKSDRKSENMNRQVVETGKLAAIGELAAGIAHEINNPVAIMVEEAGWIGDLLDEESPVSQGTADEFRRALNQIATQGRRCKDITHKLLSFARKSDATVSDIQINDTIREIVSLTAQMARYNNVTIQVSLAENLPRIRFSPAELQQVILNLINNAIDAMEKQGGHISVTTGLFSGSGRSLLIEVRDNGPGIPAQNLDRIFDPFFTTKAVGQGTGLGLSICYGIIRKMGGQISVESTVGQGTCFSIYLPVEKTHESGGDPPDSDSATQVAVDNNTQDKGETHDQGIVC